MNLLLNLFLTNTSHVKGERGNLRSFILSHHSGKRERMKESNKTEFQKKGSGTGRDQDGSPTREDP